MPRPFPIAAALTLLVAATSGGARPALAQQATYYQFCWTPASKQLVYVSAPFQGTEARTALLAEAFNAFVRKQYGYTANDGQCSVDLNARARDLKRTQVLNAAQNGEVTPVTFTYVPSGVPATSAAPAPAAPPPVAGSASLDPGNLKDPWLKRAREELPGARGYCETNILLHRIFDCDCFARLVFQFRVAHAANYKESNREEGTGWVGFSNILMAQDFTCTSCLEEARLKQYVRDKMLENNTPAIQMGRTTADKVKARAECVAPKYIAEFKTHPHVFEEQGNWNRAATAAECLSP